MGLFIYFTKSRCFIRNIYILFTNFLLLIFPRAVQRRKVTNFTICHFTLGVLLLWVRLRIYRFSRFFLGFLIILSRCLFFRVYLSIYGFKLFRYDLILILLNVFHIGTFIQFFIWLINHIRRFVKFIMRYLTFRYNIDFILFLCNVMMVVMVTNFATLLDGWYGKFLCWLNRFGSLEPGPRWNIWMIDFFLLRKYFHTIIFLVFIPNLLILKSLLIASCRTSTRFWFVMVLSWKVGLFLNYINTYIIFSTDFIGIRYLWFRLPPWNKNFFVIRLSF